MMMARGGSSTSFLTNLVAYYKMDEASGDILDASVNGRNLTQNGTITSTTGKINTARNLGGTSNANYASRASEAAFQFGSSPFTINLWFQTSSWTQTSFPSLISKSSANAASDIEYNLFINDTNDNLSFAVSANGTTTTIVSGAGGALAINTWYMVNVQWDGTNIKMSLNAGAFQTAAFAGPLHTGPAVLEFFRRTGGSNSAACRLEEVGIWKGIALPLVGTHSVTALYNSGNGLPFSSFT